MPARPDAGARHRHVQVQPMAEARMGAVGGDDEQRAPHLAMNLRPRDPAVLDLRPSTVTAVCAHTPGVAAAISKTCRSSTRRRWPRPHDSSPGADGNRPTATRDPWWYRTPRNGTPPPPSGSPRRCSAATPAGMMPSPHGLSRGKVCASKSSTEQPRRPSAIASDAPAMPPPTITTSVTGAGAFGRAGRVGRVGEVGGSGGGKKRGLVPIRAGTRGWPGARDPRCGCVHAVRTGAPRRRVPP